MKIKAVLFDMDGVLVDSEYTMASAAIAALKEYGVSAKHEDFVDFIGAGEDKFVGGVAEKYGVPYVLSMKDRAYDIYGKMIAEQSIAFDGVLGVFEALRKMGIKMAVCSSADAVKVRYNLRSLGLHADFFDAVLTGNDVTRKKPSPDILLLAAERIDVEPEDCLVAEDAINGIIAARNAGMHHFAVTTSFDRDTLRSECAPDFIFDSITDIVSVVQKLNTY